jgi:UDP-N-acetylmuramoyl-L-alanyl-D-glutamate--2,6-diaminopimelate ligase
MRAGDVMAALGDSDPRAWAEALSLDLTGIAADSRAVRPGMLFAALPGSRTDGMAHLADALERGAAAVLAPAGVEWPDGVRRVPMITDRQPRRALARIAAIFAGRQPDHVVAITGTNGKTSTAAFLRQLWSLAGLKAASLGTLGLHAPGFAAGPGLTTPDPVSLSHTMAALADVGIGHAAMEASSHGLDQYRLDGMRLCAGAFTNLTRDHLDYHGTLEAYRAAKLRLFADLLPEGAPAVASSMLEAATQSALRDIAARRRLRLRVIGLDGAMPRPDGQDIRVAGRTIHLPLAGRFQADNAIVAAALAEATGLADPWSRLDALSGVRGRLELVGRPGNAAVYVDYAHTPDALARLIAALRPHTQGRLHLVFGAGGDRDPGKRRLMGEAALAADQVIVTDDNPRTEDPVAIRAAVLRGCPGAREIGDRARAIAAGLEGLAAGDVLAVAGKGHEQGQTIGTETHPFDDASVIRALIGAA